ncbi:MAG: patatin-like phospholipase family protein [Gammaproteobacteria bacterium]|nr:patatin-like phospholipase family protein [Gammaproteobacteria bacterium]MDH5727460.1 patatin-like phospholipase family protein [Gammaproteobacteria bacterium]
MPWLTDKEKPEVKTGLLLSGGGARAAYQVGVLKAFADILPKDTKNPFPILCGSSAGAINAAALAIYADKYREAVWRLVHVWGNFHVDQVFRANFFGLTSSSAHWLAALMLGGLGKYNPVALLDRAPLLKLLEHNLPFQNIQKNIDNNLIHALSITASSFTTGQSTAFYQGHESIDPWQRARRAGIRTELNVKHLMASSAIPFVFAAEKVEDEFFGDGSMRQTAPISPALHLGADKIVVIGVKHSSEAPVLKNPGTNPSLGQLAGHVLDSIFLDNIDMDVERLQRINKTFSRIPNKHIPTDSASLRQVELLHIAPSQDLYKIAQKHAELMPRSVRFFLHGIGVSKDRGSNLLSYLLFEKAYCRELMNLGYGDAMERRQEIIQFFNLGYGEHLPLVSIPHEA